MHYITFAMIVFLYHQFTNTISIAKASFISCNIL